MDDPRRYLPLSPQQFHILLALAGGERHGYGIIRDVESRTDGALRLGTGTLYTAVARLLALDLVAEATHRPARGEKDDERRRYYRLTTTGRTVLEAETARLESLVRHARKNGVRPLRADTR